MAHSTRLLQQGDPWGNYYAPESVFPEDARNNSRNSATSLHEWQDRVSIEAGHLNVREQPNDQGTAILHHRPDNSVRSEFAIQGGSEYPRLMVRLTLTHANSTKNVQLTAFFPAWNADKSITTEKLRGTPVPGQALPLPGRDGEQRFTFSDSVADLRFRYDTLSPEMKAETGMSDDAKHWMFRWRSSVEPICINFNANLDHLTERQRRIARDFKQLRRSQNIMQVIVFNQRSSIGANIAYLVNMPNPTPCPYPRYDPRYNFQHRTLQRLHVRNIQPHTLNTLETNDATIHHAARRDGWQRQPPNQLRGHVQQTGDGQSVTINSIALRGVNVVAQAPQSRGPRPGIQYCYFLSERDYEVCRIVGLAREVQTLELSSERLFNRRYNFNLIPAGQTNNPQNTLTHEYYIFLNVRPTVLNADNIATPPQPQTRVTIIVREESVQQGMDRANQRPFMALNSSGMRSAMIVYNRGMLGARFAGTAPTTSLSRRSSSVGSFTIGDLVPRLAGLSPIGSPVIAAAQGDREWTGTVIPRIGSQHDEFDICIKVQVPDTGVGMGVQDISGHFIFGQSGQPYLQSEQAIHMVLYGEMSFYRIPRQNWLKCLLLAHNNTTIGQKSPEGQLPQDLDLPPGIVLNDLQKQCAMRAVSTFDPSNINTGITMIMGPPGTGKTVLAAAVAFHCTFRKEKVLLTAGSNYAVDNLADAIYKILHPIRPTSLQWQEKNTNRQKSTSIQYQAREGVWGVFRLMKESDEHFSNFASVVEARAYENPTAQDGQDECEWTLESSEFTQAILQGVITDTEYRAIEQYVRHRATTNLRLSLGDHIIARIQKARAERSDWVHDWREADVEYVLIWRFITYRVRLSKLGYNYADVEGPTTRAHQAAIAGEMSREAITIGERSVQAWRDLSSLYLEHARIVLCTASTAGRKTLRRFRANRVLIDESAQLTEIDSVNAVVRNFSTLSKIILIGDRNQLQPTVISRNQNEYYFDHQQSLMARMEDSGLPKIMLKEQRRMDPDISKFISQEFYNGVLFDHSSVQRRDAARNFKTWMRSWIFKSNSPNKALSAIWFLANSGSTVLHRRGHSSSMNPYFLSDVIDVFDAMYTALKQTSPTAKFAILAFYAEEVLLLKRWVHSRADMVEEDVAVITVDASQGREYDYVVLSTCRIGGNHGLGFVADRRRMNVAISRAKNGIVIVGDENMGQQVKGKPISTAATAWQNLIDYCKSKGAFVRHAGKSTTVVNTLGLNLEQDYVVNT